MLHRDAMEGKGPELFCNKIRQDHQKLENSYKPTKSGCDTEGFVQKFQTIAFFYDSTKLDKLRGLTEKFENVRIQSCIPIKGK
jgi:hypothetical protein